MGQFINTPKPIHDSCFNGYIRLSICGLQCKFSSNLLVTLIGIHVRRNFLKKNICPLLNSFVSCCFLKSFDFTVSFTDIWKVCWHSVKKRFLVIKSWLWKINLNSQTNTNQCYVLHKLVMIIPKTQGGLHSACMLVAVSLNSSTYQRSYPHSNSSVIIPLFEWRLRLVTYRPRDLFIRSLDNATDDDAMWEAPWTLRLPRIRKSMYR